MSTDLAVNPEPVNDAEDTSALVASPSLSSLSGAQKALLFLVSIEESIATRILSFLRAPEVAELRAASETLEEVDPEAILGIHREFIEVVQQGVPTSLKGSGAYLRRLAGKALGEGQIADLWEGKREVHGAMADIGKLDVATILPMLEREHTQTLAVIFSMLDPEYASELLGHFPAEQQSEILRRTALLKSVPQSVVDEIERQFAAELQALGDMDKKEIDGVEAAAGLLKRLDAERAEELIQELDGIDTEAAERVRKAMFTFEHLLRVDGRGMQALLKEISTDQLTLALKTASEELKEKIFGNISARAAATLRDELELMGPVRLSDVEAAQGAIVETALGLERDGKIQIAREGGGDYV